MDVHYELDLCIKACARSNVLIAMDVLDKS